MRLATLEAVQALLDEERPESRELDYKETLPGRSDSEVKEFLADVVSFANTSGGHIVFGIREQRDSGGTGTGVPAEVVGLTDVNLDAEVLRMENLIRDGIAPRIPGVEFQAVSGFAPGPVLVLWIPKSFASPHMVTAKGSSRFLARNSAGKYPLDVGEIRSAFARTEGLPAQLASWRNQRIAELLANQGPVPVVDGPKLVLHLVSFSSLGLDAFVDVTEAERLAISLRPLGTGGLDHRFNADGFATFAAKPDGEALTYVQVFREGRVEAVNSVMLRGIDQERRLIPSVAYEKRLIENLLAYINVLRELGTQLPVFVMVSMLGVEGYSMAVGGRLWQHDGRPCTRNILTPRETVVDEWDAEPDMVLRPSFDQFWQACGWPRSMNYDEQGRWRGQG